MPIRPVKSRILWEQLLGRGTRRCPDINKSHFTVFDCFDGTLLENFKLEKAASEGKKGADQHFTPRVLILGEQFPSAHMDPSSTSCQ